MNLKNKYRILIWIIVILLASNLSMIFSSFYHKKSDKKEAVQTEEAAIEMPAQRRTRFFKEQLNLQPDQMDVFRTLNRIFNPEAREITLQLEALRIEMVTELGKETSNQGTLDYISKNIGKLHSELKDRTIEYYLKMKEVCTKEQQEKLNAIFMSVLKKNEDVTLPRPGGRGFHSK